MALPKKGVAYDFFISLIDLDDSSQFLVDPTIVTGDFQISRDDAAFTNINVPVVTPAGSSSVKVSLSAQDMNADKVVVQGIDQDDEWQQITIFIDIPSGNVDGLFDFNEGDRSESSTRLMIKKKDTEDIILDKDIAGSLLSPSVTITTEEHE